VRILPGLNVMRIIKAWLFCVSIIVMVTWAFLIGSSGHVGAGGLLFLFAGYAVPPALLGAVGLVLFGRKRNLGFVSIVGIGTVAGIIGMWLDDLWLGLSNPVLVGAGFGMLCSIMCYLSMSLKGSGFRRTSA
jgi:hypothetical protein